MKKVMFSIGQLFGGGAERVVSVWANQMCNAGYDVSILVYGRGKKEYSVDSRIPIYTITENYSDAKKMNYCKRLFAMRRIIKRNMPDTIISFLPGNQIMVALACIGIHIKRIDTVRINPWIMTQLASVSKNLLWNMCFFTSDAIIIQTEEQRTFFPKCIRKKCAVISNPLAPFFIDYLKTDYIEYPRKFVAAGRIDPQKNYSLMIRSFIEAHKINPNISLDIYGKVGSQDYKDTLDKMILELSATDYIRFKGHASKMSEVYPQYDSFLLTSDYEGMPNSLAEAMACSLVCMSTSCKTGPKDMIQNSINGFLVEPGNIKESTRTILMISKMSLNDTKRIGEAAKSSILNLCGTDNSLTILKSII